MLAPRYLVCSPFLSPDPGTFLALPARPSVSPGGGGVGGAPQYSDPLGDALCLSVSLARFPGGIRLWAEPVVWRIVL